MTTARKPKTKEYPTLSPVYIRKEVQAEPKPGVKSNKLALPTLEGIDFEEIRNIISLEAKGNYTVIYLMDGRQLMVCKTLCDLEKMLLDKPFVRIHRSHAINLNLIVKYVKGKGGYAVMENGQTINVSASRKRDFMKAIKLYF